MRSLSVLLSVFLLLSCTQGGPAPADKIISNARIFTVNAEQPWAQALAVSNGKIIFVGDNEKVLQYRDKNTQFIDLGGRVLMPGINDAHLHPILGASKELFECRFDFSATPQQIAEAVSGCAKNAGNNTWIRGGQWSSDFFVNHTMASPREWLDKYSGDKAVVLVDDAYHNIWLNSRAYELLELKEDGELPHGVEFQRDSAGRFNGIVIEAFGFLKDRLPLTAAQNKKAAQHAMSLANAAGITGMKGTAVAEAGIRGFAALADDNALTAHMAIAIYTGYGHRESALDVAALQSLRDNYTRPGLDLSFAKVFMDGVPTAARTAAMLAPYVALPQESQANFGMQHLKSEQLRDDVVALDKAGFTVKIHAAGDRSVRMALDAIAAARQANGNSGLRHELAHAGFIDDADMARFTSLQAVADLSPYIWYPSPIIDSVASALGKRAEHYWPVKDLLAGNAPVAIGSDWPAAVPTLNPWPGLEALVTRADPYADTAETLWPEQAITVEQAVRIFTLDGAKALRLEQLTGSIEVGKSADFIELDQDIFSTDVRRISATRVLRTWLRGRLVHGE